MKKIFLGLLFAAAIFCNEDAFAAADGSWGAFGFGSDIDGADTGAGGGLFGRLRTTSSVFLTGRAFAATYDDIERGQLLIGGEWVDRNRNVTGYIGVQAGAEFFNSDTSDITDKFARIYYDIGVTYSKGAEIRLGIAYDAALDNIDRKGGARFSWYSDRAEDSMAFFVTGEFFDNERNVLVGATWPL